MFNKNTLLFFVALMTCTPAFRIGDNCSVESNYSSSYYCGHDLFLEKLVCENGVCKGIQNNSRCSASDLSTPCASGYYCNAYGVCESCSIGCTTCTNSSFCTVCSTTYYLSEGACIALSDGCLIGNSNGCNTCQAGYFLKTSVTPNTCESCISHCEVCSNKTSCDKCSNGYYFFSSSNMCSSTVTNCAVGNASMCTTCDSGYYIYTASDGTPLCNAMKENCYFVLDNKACKSCGSGYFLGSDFSCGEILIEGCDTSSTSVKACSNCTTGRHLHKTCSSTVANCRTYSDFQTCSACKDGYYLSSNTCKACYTHCKTCTSSDAADCTSTSDGYLSYLASTRSNCEACPIGCAVCSSSTTCTSCSRDFYLSGSTCLAVISKIVGCLKYSGASVCQECEPGYFVSSGICTFCLLNCVICSSPTVCTTCKSGYVGNTVSSPTSCNAIENCKTYTTNACSECISGYFPASGGLYCTACQPSNTSKIERCTGLNAITSCQSGFGVYRNMYCEPCLATGAARCSITTAGVQTVTGCATSYTFVSGACVLSGSVAKYANCAVGASGSCTTCIDGYTVNSGACFKTIANCLTYANTSSCSACQSGYSRQSATICIACNKVIPHCSTCSTTNKECSACDSGYYLSSSTICSKCGTGVKVCTASAKSIATSSSNCLSGYYYLASFPTVPCSDSHCLSCPASVGECEKCASGYFVAAGACSACGSNCENCTSLASCTICKTGYYLSSGSCTSGVANCVSHTSAAVCTKCDTGYYLATSSSCVECVGKSSGVATCDAPKKAGGTTEALTCADGYFAKDYCEAAQTGCNITMGVDTCSICLEGYALNSLYVCEACASGCTCSTAGGCDACRKGYYSSGPGACTICPTECTICSSGSECLACQAGYYLNSFSCTACISTSTSCVCDDGYYFSLGTCATCITGCSKCFDAVSCTTCKPNYYLEDGLCKESYSNCSVAYGLKACKECMMGYYLNESTNSCDSCTKISNCKVCSSSSTCVVCESGYYLNNGNCVACSLTNCAACSNSTTCDQCSEGYYYDSSNSVCNECPTGCSICSNGSSCSVCKSTFFKDSSTLLCVSCISGCDVCLDTVSCTTCSSKYYLNSNKTCSICSNLCATCGGPGEENCTSCVTNATLEVATTYGCCTCYANHRYSTSSQSCIPETTTDSGVHSVLGVLTLLAIVLTLL